MDYKSALKQAPEAVVAILIRRLGGKVEISQREFDAVATGRLFESPDFTRDVVEFRYVPKPDPAPEGTQ